MNYLAQMQTAAHMTPRFGDPAVDTYFDLREQGLSKRSAREHVRLIHGVDVDVQFGDSVVVTPL